MEDAITNEQKNFIIAANSTAQAQEYAKILAAELELKIKDAEWYRKRAQESDVVWKRHCNLANLINAVQTICILAVCAAIVMKIG